MQGGRAAALVALCAWAGGCPDFPEELLRADAAARDAALRDAAARDAAPGEAGPSEAAIADLLRVDQRPPDQRRPDQRSPDQLAVDGSPADAAGPTVPGTWISVAAGSFAMGSPSAEPCRSPGEVLHQVTLSRGFAIAATEVTQEQFLALMQRNPAANTACGATCPVERVSWNEAAAYCNALSALAGQSACYSCTGSGAALSCTPAFAAAQIYACPGYRLPTEAEWEYAYRAGSTTALYNGPFTGNCNGADVNAAAIAWYGDNSGNATHPAAHKQANAWGLSDMAGNVWEWVHDYDGKLDAAAATDPAGPATGTLRVYRGGSFFYAPKYVRAAYRAALNPNATSTDLGFRCAKSTLP